MPLYTELNGNMEDAPHRSCYPAERSSSLFRHYHQTMVELAESGKEDQVLPLTQAPVSETLREQNEVRYYSRAADRRLLVYPIGLIG